MRSPWELPADRTSTPARPGGRDPLPGYILLPAGSPGSQHRLRGTSLASPPRRSIKAELEPGRERENLPLQRRSEAHLPVVGICRELACSPGPWAEVSAGLGW